jgi:hypothetical protein
VTPAQLRNIGLYALIALGGAVLATGLQLGVVLSGDAPILWRPLAATFVSTLFASLATAAGTAFRPRTGHEDVAALVSQVGTEPARAALEVEAVKQATGIASAPLTTEQRRMIVDDLEARLRAQPAESDDPPITRPPRWLPPDPHDAVTGTPPLPPERPS